MPILKVSSPIRRLLGGSLAIGLVLVAPWLGGSHHLGDSSELATVIAEPGIAHPPGYPAYTLLGHVWGRCLGLVPGVAGDRWVLFGNLFSSVWYLAALLAAAGCIGPWLRPQAALSGGEDPRWRPLLLALAGVLFLASQPSLLRAAVVTEVYAMHLGLHAGTWLLLAHEIRRQDGSAGLASGRWVFALGLLTGLGCVHHLTYVLMLPASVLVLARGLSGGSWRRRAGRLAAGAGGFVLGLAPVLYLPLRARQGPRMNWGQLDDDPARLWDHVTAAQYGSKLGNPLRRDMLPTLTPGEVCSLVFALIVFLVAMEWWVSRWPRSAGGAGAATARHRMVGLLLGHGVLIALFASVYEIRDIVDYLPPLGWNLGVAGALAATSAAARPFGRRGDRFLVPAAVTASVALAALASAETARALRVERRITANLVAMWRALPDRPAVVVHRSDTIGVLHYERIVAGSHSALVPFNPLSATLGAAAMRAELTAVRMAPIVLYDAERYPDAARFLSDQDAVADEILRNVVDRSPLPVYFLDPLQARTRKRAEDPAVDYVETLRAAGELPADVELLPRALVERRVRELREP